MKAQELFVHGQRDEVVRLPVSYTSCSGVLDAREKGWLWVIVEYASLLSGNSQLG